ncbi:hypothetical protein DICVIV_13870 [Dictyocaulus viviparus]|uniref:Uncharacterized protein n=2 Tax=Dictyocaulus viviparus TaxID=29172 RepID=A0A0D8X9A9_DICVI|nr:hypothetical protein DICVIV_13870 [Dictyocaulus viviparus]
MTCSDVKLLKSNLAEVTHVDLIIVLLLSEAYGDPTSIVITNQNETVSSFDVDKFKVVAALGAHGLCVLCLFICLLANNVPKITQYLPPIVIITILAFDLVFNIIGGVSLWVHTSKPTGHSTSIRGAATISTVACVYTIGIIILYCKQKPMHPSLKELRADKKLPTSTTQKAKEEKNDRKAKNNESVGTNKNKSKIIQLNETQLRKNDVNDEKKRQQSG